jgi:hypothetical protein
MSRALLLIILLLQFGTARRGSLTGAPSPPPGPPTFVNSDYEFSGGSVATLNSSASFTVTSGDVLVVVCSSGSYSLTSITATDNNSDSFTTLGYNPVSGAGAVASQVSYVIGAHSGSPTFTCHSVGANSFLQIVVLQYHPGYLTGLTTGFYSNFGGFGNWTSSNFSTGPRSLIIACANPSANPGSYSAYTIGALSTNVRQILCWDATAVTTQTSITAGVNVTSGVSWAGQVLVFN